MTTSDPAAVAELLTTVRLARLFRVSRVSVNNWRNSGCPFVRIPGDSRDVPRYVLKDVVAWRIERRLPVPPWVKSRLSRAAKAGVVARSRAVARSRR